MAAEVHSLGANPFAWLLPAALALGAALSAVLPRRAPRRSPFQACLALAATLLSLAIALLLGGLIFSGPIALLRMDALLFAGAVFVLSTAGFSLPRSLGLPLAALLGAFCIGLIALFSSWSPIPDAADAGVRLLRLRARGQTAAWTFSIQDLRAPTRPILSLSGSGPRLGIGIQEAEFWEAYALIGLRSRFRIASVSLQAPSRAGETSPSVLEKVPGVGGPGAIQPLIAGFLGRIGIDVCSLASAERVFEDFETIDLKLEGGSLLWSTISEVPSAPNLR